MSYISAVEQVIEEKQEEVSDIRLAKVTAVVESKPYVTFFGETVQSDKVYKHISGYTPAVNDTVCLIRQAKTYIILGKITDEVSSSTEYATKKSVDDILDGTTTVPKATDAENAGSATSATTASTAYALGVTTDDGYTVSLTTGSGGGDLVPNKINQGIGSSEVPFYAGYIKNLYFNHSKTKAYYFDTTSATQSGSAYYAILKPSSNKGIDVGTSSYMLRNVYANQFYQNGTAISTSDRNKKNTIETLADKFKEFFKKLRPVTFKFNDGESGRLHAGFIAQEVEEAMHESGINNTEFAGLIIQEDGSYGLRYEEFIAVQTAVIQDLIKRVEKLEKEGNDGK